MKAAPEAGHVFQLMRRAAREDAGTRGGAGRNGAKSIREVHAFLGDAVKGGCLYCCTAVGRSVLVGPIVANEEKDVRAWRSVEAYHESEKEKQAHGIQKRGYGMDGEMRSRKPI